MRLAFIVFALLVMAGLAFISMAPSDTPMDPAAPTPQSSITAQADAKTETHPWGTLITYAEGETHGTRDALAAVAIINPGMEIHPPHEHAEEEYLMVTEGSGTWSLNGLERAAGPGDMLYAAPWEIHGITNSGAEPMTFVVWKWNSKGVPLASKPE